MDFYIHIKGQIHVKYKVHVKLMYTVSACQVCVHAYLYKYANSTLSLGRSEKDLDQTSSLPFLIPTLDSWVILGKSQPL